MAVQITGTSLAFESSSVQKCVFIAEIIQNGHSLLYAGQALWPCLAPADAALWGPCWGRGDLGEQQEVRGWGNQQMSTEQRSGWGTLYECWSVGSAAPGAPSATSPQQFQGRGCWEKGWQAGFGTAWSFALVVCGSAMTTCSTYHKKKIKEYMRWNTLNCFRTGFVGCLVPLWGSKGLLRAHHSHSSLKAFLCAHPQWLFICYIILYFV